VAIRTRFVQPGKIEIVANERAVYEKIKAAFSFAPTSILSLMIFHPVMMVQHLLFIIPATPSVFKIYSVNTKKSPARLLHPAGLLQLSRLLKQNF
jgi:hypothetical protein